MTATHNKDRFVTEANQPFSGVPDHIDPWDLAGIRLRAEKTRAVEVGKLFARLARDSRAT
jgi:hypothetical protein